MLAEQGSSLFSPIKNSGLFSNHWLMNRLPFEPEWAELRDAARQALEEIADLWKTEKNLVAKYGDEQGLEAAVIHPVLRALGWKFKYQAWLEGREPDYALFPDDRAYEAAIQAGRNAPEFWNHPVALGDAITRTATTWARSTSIAGATASGTRKRTFRPTSRSRQSTRAASGNSFARRRRSRIEG